MGEQTPFGRDTSRVYRGVRGAFRPESGSLTWSWPVGGAALPRAEGDELALALHLKAIGTFKLNMQSYLGEALNGRLLDYRIWPTV